MGTELVSETSENLHILALLSARETFIGFCRHESFKTCNMNIYIKVEELTSLIVLILYVLFQFLKNFHAGSSANRDCTHM